MAGYSVNRISSTSRVFTLGVPTEWDSDSVGVTLTNSATIQKYSGKGSLAAEVTDGDEIVFNRNLTTDLPVDTACCVTTNDLGDSVRAFFWIKSSARLTVNFTCELIYPVTNSPYYAAQSTTSVGVVSGEWTLIMLDTPVAVPNDSYNYAISFLIAFNNIDGASADINISTPAAYGTLDFIKNPFLLSVYRQIPLYVREQDMLTELGNMQLARFLETLIIHQGEIYDLVRQIAYLDISQGKDVSDVFTLSKLVNPDVASVQYLLWLAQFTGSTIISPKTGVTPWVNLPTTWEGIDIIDDDDAAGFESVEWTELEQYDTSNVGNEAFLRWQVKYAYYGYAAGTRQAIEESIKRVLTGDKTLAYDITDPWEITLQTLQSETPDSSGVTIGQPVLPLLELAEPARPLGVKVLHQVQTSIP